MVKIRSNRLPHVCYPPDDELLLLLLLPLLLLLEPDCELGSCIQRVSENAVGCGLPGSFRVTVIVTEMISSSVVTSLVIEYSHWSPSAYIIESNGVLSTGVGDVIPPSISAILLSARPWARARSRAPWALRRAWRLALAQNGHRPRQHRQGQNHFEQRET